MFNRKMCEHSSGWRPEDGVPDLAMMSDITANSININLRTRYQRDQIYTYSGSILIAVNPYRPLDIYDEQWISHYRGQKLDQLDPHIFALTEAMYVNMVMQDYNSFQINNEHDYKHNSNLKQSSEKGNNIRMANPVQVSLKNQACVISGESGAGKTETTKFILSYLCSVTPNKSIWMEHEILEANTILEAFGNAKTVRNDNSSRFGKFIQICFDHRHQINGCIIQDYLLEQSRITYQSIDERNYHVFYQLVAAGRANPELRQKFHLMPANFYNFLNNSQCYTIDGVDDCTMFDSLRTAMSVLNMEQEYCDGLFSILSAILWIGNLQFKTDDDEESIKQSVEQCHLTEADDEIIKTIADLLGVTQDKLRPIMLKRQINVRGSITEIPFKIHEARDNRNAMAKALYSRLFTWVVNFINASINPGSDQTICFLGVLDIFGFENFETNSFEQLCINYANEKLHKFFNHHMFAMEQELYHREGIEFCDINFTDNTACLELLERPPNCILRLLSEECRMPKGSDVTFIEKLHAEFSTTNPNPFYIRGYDRRKWFSEFSVKHFAGSVTYRVDGFLEKNKDSQQGQLLDIMEASTNPLLRDVVTQSPRFDTHLSGLESTPNSRTCSFRQGSNDSIITSKPLTQSATNESCISSSSSGSEDRSIHQTSCSSIVARLQHQHSLRNQHQNKREPVRRESSVLERQFSISSSSNINPTKSRPTVADTFRQQLSLLVDLLSSVNPWYVRCIKPNLEKSATDYDDRQVLMQLKYLGMSDLIKIRREGYPIHFTKHQFVCRYRCLMLKYLRINPNASPIGLDEAKLDNYCLRMMDYFELSNDDWRIGKNMVLLRAKVYQPLEERRNQLFIDMATLIQSSWKSFVERRRYIRLRGASVRIQESFRAYRGKLLYLRKKRAVLTIQAYVRGMFAREIANALREIKRAEREKAVEQELKELQDKTRTEKLESDLATQNKTESNPEQFSDLPNCKDSEVNSTPNKLDTQIVVTDHSISNQLKNELVLSHENSPLHMPCSDVSSMSSIASLNCQDINEARSKMISARDRKEMEELIKVLERHGLSLDKLDQDGDGHYSDFEKLYDVLGNQLQINNCCDTQSISPSANGDDDRCSFATTFTNGDGDSVSCSGHSQISSTVTDEQLGNEDKKSCLSTTTDSQADGAQISTTATSESTREDTIGDPTNQFALNTMQDDAQYHSNSIESIASIMSSASTHSANPSHQHNGSDSSNQAQTTPSETQASYMNNHDVNSLAKPISLDSATRTSTFTGHSLIVTGSKLVSNGRPLTRIEEEPNSATSSPSKTPHKKHPETSVARPRSLFEPQERSDTTGVVASSKAAHIMECKKRRVERKILQVQQEQLQQPINPTTAGLLTKAHDSSLLQQQLAMVDNSRDHIAQSQSTRAITDISPANDQIYGDGKNSIIEYAEQVFNCHPRDFSGATGMIRTLTRRRRSVDCAVNEYLSKAEMLSYNPSFTIPTSHIKMHDPHNEQLSCSLFKNLCKYMTGDGVKLDAEIRIIQSIIRNGIEKQELRDEIYVQVIRQLTNNPNHDYCLRLWAFLGLVSAAFAPSKPFAKHLVAYLRNKPRKHPSITCHVQFCLDNLQAPRLSARKYPPSPLEIQACKSLTNLTCKIHLLDGRCETMSIHPCDTALEMLTKVAQRVNLQSTEGWALYESYTPGASKYPHPTYEQKGDFERSIKSQTFMADLIASWQDRTTLKSIANPTLKVAQKHIDEGNFRLTLKKRIFRGPKIRNDPAEISLLYAQAVYNVVKKDTFYVDENLALSLAGLQAQVTIGNAMDAIKQSTHDGKKGKQKSTATPKVSVKSSSQIYNVENFICVRLRNQASRSKKEWCNLIAQSHKQFHNVNEVFCKMRYLSMVIYHCPLYGTATFDVLYKGYQNMDQNLILGVNAEGLVLIRSSDKALMNAYRYSDIAKEGGITVYTDENIIQLTVKDRSENDPRCLAFESTDNEEIALLMMSYSPALSVYIRGSNSTSYRLDASFDQNAMKRRTRLKMTLEDRMRTHQEVQNARKAIIRSGKLRKPIYDENSANLFKHTLRRLSSNKTVKQSEGRSTRFETIYGTLGGRNKKNEMSQTSSDYNIYKTANGLMFNETLVENEQNEVAGATSATIEDELTRAYPHRYWAYTKTQLKNSLLIIYDPDLEEAALANFNAILTFSGLLMPHAADSGVSSNNSTLDSGSVDSGIASQQSLSNLNNKNSSGSPSSVSSNEIYDVCPKKLDQHDLIRLAQAILDRSLKKDADILKNEFFLQLIKQTTDHPDPNSDINQRHWQLLALACSVTYPSDSKILSYLYAHLRRCSLDQVTNEGHYAQFTLRSLQGTLDTKGRRLAPSEIEILSTINCRRVYARVYFLDGQFQAVEFDPCATIAEVIDQIKQKIGLPSNSSGHALFQPLDDDCEQALHPEEKVGDAISTWESWQKQKQGELEKQLKTQPNSTSRANNLVNTNSVNKESLAALNAGFKTRAHKFVFKKYLFIDSLTDLDNPVERELSYYQIVASMKEDKFPVLEQEATLLCALKAQIEIGEYVKLAGLPREHVRMVYKQIIISLMPPRIFNNLQIPAIAHQHQILGELSCVDAKKYFFRLIQTCGIANLPDNLGYILLHRSSVYDATQTFATAWPSDVWICVNQSGVHMVVARTRRVLASCEYRLILDYNANNNYLIIIMMAASQSKIKHTFYTKQAQQIAQQIRDYIMVNTSNGNKRRKSVEFNLKQQQPTTEATSRNYTLKTALDT